MSEQIQTVNLTEEQNQLLDTVIEKMQNLEAQLQEENPGIDQWVKDINSDLRQWPELVHLLSNEQRKPYYMALREITKVAISAKTSKSRKASNKLADGRQVGDLI